MVCGVGDRGYGTQHKDVDDQDVDEMIDYSFLIDGREMVREVKRGTYKERHA